MARSSVQNADGTLQAFPAQPGCLAPATRRSDARLCHTHTSHAADSLTVKSDAHLVAAAEEEGVEAACGELNKALDLDHKVVACVALGPHRVRRSCSSTCMRQRRVLVQLSCCAARYFCVGKLNKARHFNHKVFACIALGPHCVRCGSSLSRGVCQVSTQLKNMPLDGSTEPGADNAIVLSLALQCMCFTCQCCA